MKHLLLLSFALILLSCSNEEENEILYLPSCYQKYLQMDDSLARIENDEIEGDSIRTYIIHHLDHTGKLWKEAEYRDCYKKGLEYSYYQNGQLRYKRYYHGKSLVSTFKYYSEKGDSLNPGSVSWGEGYLFDYYGNGKKQAEGQIKNVFRIG